MLRFVLLLISLLFCSFVVADTTWYHVYGCGAFCKSQNIYSSPQSACSSDNFNFGSPPKCNGPTYGGVQSYSVSLDFPYCSVSFTCNNNSNEDFQTSIVTRTCGDQEVWTGSSCQPITCPEGDIFDSETMSCYTPSACDLNPDHHSCSNDDFSDDDPVDDSDNVGGSDNEHGGEPGAECNFSPEGCAPWDRAPDNDIGDIDAPDANAPAPPDAVTTKSKTESTSDGSTTSTNVRQWEEPDGSIVKETVKETINPDGSKTTEKILERSSPNGSTSTTTVKSDTDPQGNVTITGTTEDKQTEKDEYASGGGSCDAAPSCNGDPIDCAILNQQWLTRCDKNAEYSDSDCSAQPQCSGDVLLCAGLINEWQNRCSMEKAASDAQGFFEERGFKTAEDYAAEGGVFGSPEETDMSTVADSVFAARSSVAGSCPQAISFTAQNFGTFEISLEPFCILAEEIYWLVILSAYMTAAFIIFRSITN